MSRAQIAEDIKFAIDNHYIDRFGSDGTADIRVRDRLKSECRFIFQIAWKCWDGNPPALPLKPID